VFEPFTHQFARAAIAGLGLYRGSLTFAHFSRPRASRTQ
jgi:hypothetical protein